MDKLTFSHKPVMASECIEGLAIKPEGIYVDGTVGGGGHSELICQRLSGGRLIGIDRDSYAIKRASERLAPFGQKVTLVNDNFLNLSHILKSLGEESADGVLLDLGVSSFQLDDASRGFSYMQDAPLDMRMAQGEGMSAADVVNRYDEARLAKLLFEYGEERFARQIAKKICLSRPINSTLELVDIIKSALPSKALHGGGHPAKRSFQAIRIEVNGELEIIESSINSTIECLKSGGRIAVITFHSLEDRLVKQAFTAAAKGCVCPGDFPVCVCGKKPLIKIITKKPILPSAKELAENSRASSAKLRIAQKI